MMPIQVGRDGVVMGKWSEKEIHTMYGEGRLQATDWYLKEGMIAWAPLEELIKTTPVSAYPTGLVPVTKRRNVTASQIMPRTGKLAKVASTTTKSLGQGGREFSKTTKRFPRISNLLPGNESSAKNSQKLPPAKTGFTALLSFLFPTKKKAEYDKCRREALDYYVMQINLSGSFLIDEVTQLNGAKLGADGAIHFRYTVFTPTPGDGAEVQEVMLPALQEDYRTSSQNEVLRQYGVVTKHEFVHKSGARLCQLTVGPDQPK